MSLLKWAKEEENLALRDVFSKVFEVSNIWANIWKDFNDEVFENFIQGQGLSGMGPARGGGGGVGGGWRMLSTL